MTVNKHYSTSFVLFFYVIDDYYGVDAVCCHRMTLNGHPTGKKVETSIEQVDQVDNIHNKIKWPSENPLLLYLALVQKDTRNATTTPAISYKKLHRSSNFLTLSILAIPYKDCTNPVGFGNLTRFLSRCCSLFFTFFFCTTTSKADLGKIWEEENDDSDTMPGWWRASSFFIAHHLQNIPTSSSLETDE